ncbi:MAG: polysaccharide pyruvyl transferase family protein [Planctomycetota bacterium]|nr:polysaccharide pyruvyl transferase family protein [Planctomycetota bacterium]
MGDDRFLLVGNGTYLNRGCEAIVRGTARLLRTTFERPRFVNMIMNPLMPSESDPDIVHHPLRRIVRWSPRWAAMHACDFFCPPLSRGLRFGQMKTEARRAIAALSIGGDNYTLDYGVPQHYVDLGKYLARQKIPVFLWGASVGPFEKEPDFARVMFSHLRRDVSGVFVRERRSYDYLKSKGLADKVHMMPDPAFVMEPVPVDVGILGLDMQAQAPIGLNVSPLMARYMPGVHIREFIVTTTEIIRALVRKWDRPIVLIPHVTSPHSNDHALLKAAFDFLKDHEKERVICLPDNLSAAETKWIISQLHCLVAARTHATIAAFSSYVPTVSFAYSCKAYGLNELLFGHTNYLLSPEEVIPDRVVEKVSVVLQDTSMIQGCLRKYMGSVYLQAEEAVLALKHSLESGG